MSKRGRERDPLADIREWQDHRLDPGHFTGGNVHPVLRSRRPNRYGYVLLVGGFISVFALGGLIRSGQTWLAGGTLLGAVVGIGAGLSLVRRRPAGPDRKRG